MRLTPFALATLVIAARAFAAEPAGADAAMLRRIYDTALTDSPMYGHLGELVEKFPGRLSGSLTHALDDNPHTGYTGYLPEVPRIPAAALSTIAANRLSAALKADPTLQAELVINSRWFDPAPSHNVIGEIRGSEHPEKIILVGGHLDSWDITPGAHDDGSGVVQSMEVLRILQTAGYKPRHTIRCVLFSSEENSLNGALEYARLVGERKEEHLLALESDNGGFQPHGFQLGNTLGNAHVKAARWRPLFEPYNITIF